MPLFVIYAHLPVFLCNIIDIIIICSFDTAVMYNAIGHLGAVLEKVLKECLRVTKPGGAIFVISSFRMDMPAIDEKLLPLLAKKQIAFAEESDGTFRYIKIVR